MKRLVYSTAIFLSISLAFIATSDQAVAVRLITNPSTADNSPPLEFDTFSLTPDGNTIVAIGLFNDALVEDRVYTFPVPDNPAVDVSLLTQITSDDFALLYDADDVPAISPDGTTVLYSNDGRTADVNTIHKVAIGGEGSGPLDGLFSGTAAGSNSVSPGIGNFNPRYSADGNTVYFINSESGFNGNVPDFTTPDSPSSWDDPDWDQLYSVPVAGGTATAITAPSDGDLDGGLWSVTPNGSSIVYAPDNPIALRSDRGDQRPKLFSVPAVGGTSTEIPMPAAGHSTFSITSRVEVTPDGNNILFVGDYETPGKNELYSVPIAGGTPTRLSDDLPFAGDVTTFEISPDGTKVAYTAGQNTSANSELFLKTIGGAAGSSIRVSDPAVSNGGQTDVSRFAGRGTIAFSNDGSEIYYLGDFDSNNVSDMYVVDTSEKTGFVPSSYTFVGATGGDFFDENNWQDAEGNPAPADSINPDTAITHSLLIDGETVGSSGGQADFGAGGSLELTPGSVLNFSNVGDQLDFNPNSGLKIENATITVEDDIILEGTNYLIGGTIESLVDDIEFQDAHDTFISGTTFRSGDNIFFENSATAITGATFEPADRIGMRFTSDLELTDTDVIIQSGSGDVDDVFAGDAGDGSRLILLGDSTLTAASIDDGIDLILGDSAIATLAVDPQDPGADPPNFPEVVDRSAMSTITLMSTDAELVIVNASDFDSRQFIVNGLTGLTYNQDPDAWNVSDWDGLSALASLKLVFATTSGDFDDDGDVDGNDFLAWQRGESSDPLSAGDLALWQEAFGEGGALTSAQTQIPEPTSIALIMISAFCTSIINARRRGSCKDLGSRRL